MTRGTAAGRPESPIDERRPFAELASRLRDMRPAKLSNREFAALAKYSAASISTALSGKILPSLELTLAIVTASGEDTTEWTEIWYQYSTARRTSSANAGRPEKEPSEVANSAPEDVEGYSEFS